jgi:hypothetical protein
MAPVADPASESCKQVQNDNKPLLARWGARPVVAASMTPAGVTEGYEKQNPRNSEGGCFLGLQLKWATCTMGTTGT